MRRLHLFVAILMLPVLAAGAAGQGCGLSTGNSDNNSCRGNFFDIVASNAAGITVTDLAVNIGSTNAVVEVWAVTGGGTYLGNETNPAAWTLLGTSAPLTGTRVSQAGGALTQLNLGLNLFVATGTTQGFLVHTPGTIAYVTGSALNLGTPMASNADLQILYGHGHCSATVFSLGNAARDWVGTVFYTYPGQAISYGSNSAGASLNIDGQAGDGCSPAVVNKQTDVDPLGQLVNADSGVVNISSQGIPGPIPYEMGISGSSLTASPPGIIIGTEHFNLSIVAPLSFLNGGLLPDFANMPGTTLPGSNGSSFSLPFSVTTVTPLTLSIQTVVVNAGHPNGIETSAPIQMDVTTNLVVPAFSPCPLTIGGDLSPLSDDGTILVPLAVGGFTFYGTNHTDVFVNMNGNLTFVTGDTDFSESEAEMLSDQARVAPAWTDWTPSDINQGTVRTYDDGIVFSCEWFDIRGFGTAACGNGVDTNSFCATFIYATGDLLLEYGEMQLCNNGTSPVTPLVGISPGASLSLANNVDLSAGGNAPAGATDAIYEAFGLGAFGAFDVGSPPGGPTNTLIFTAALGSGGTGPYIQN